MSVSDVIPACRAALAACAIIVRARPARRTPGSTTTWATCAVSFDSAVVMMNATGVRSRRSLTTRLVAGR